jgi:hypothetical protein
MSTSQALWDYLGEITDPRSASGRRYYLQSILALIIAGMMCGKQSLRSIARWGRRLSPEQLQVIGIERPSSPSQATMHNLLVRLEASCLETALGKWMQTLANPGQLHIAIDGKVIKSSATEEYPALHLLSAYCTSLHGVLYQMPVSDKQNEISAGKDILCHIPVQGNVISGDAIFCQRDICNDILTNGGDYTFIVKVNQRILFEGIQRIFSPER